MSVRTLCAALVGVLALASMANAAETTTESAVSHWQVYAWIGQDVQSGVMTMTTTGEKVSAIFKKVAIHGTLVDFGNKINATYTGPRGDGWITLDFHNNGNGFGGSWGLKGKPADGKFVGTRITASPEPASTP